MTLAQRTDYSFSLVIWLGGIRKILVPAKSRFIAISIAAGVLRPIAILVTIFPPVAMIAVVILTTRIRIEPLILVHVFASLAHSVLISSSVADIGAIAIASVIAPVVYAFVPIGVPDLPRPGSRFGNLHGSRYRNHDDRHSDTPPRIPSIADIRGWPAASLVLENRSGRFHALRAYLCCNHRENPADSRTVAPSHSRAGSSHHRRHDIERARGR